MEYELVMLDCGHIYTEPCNVLYESDQLSLIRKSDGIELAVKKNDKYPYVREVNHKVDLRTLVRYLMQEVNTDSPDNDIVTVSTKWLSAFIDKMVKAGILAEGEYEIPS